jgi:hypothetical protein
MSDHSLQSIELLPSTDNLKLRLQSLAMLDAILMKDWEMRYFSFNSGWGVGESMGSMRNGQGDEFFILFDQTGAAGKVLVHEDSLDEQRNALIRSQIPQEFSSFRNEAAFSLNKATYFFWQRPGQSWSVQPARTNYPLLAFVADEGDHYCSWARDYYEIEIEKASVRSIFKHTPLTRELVQSLNPEVTSIDIAEDVNQIGYPS